MAKTILTDAYVLINSVNLSDHVKTVTITQESDDVDITAMGATARDHALGLRNDSIEIEFYQDFAASSVDATLSPLVGSNTGFPIEVRPTSAARSTTNPGYTATAILASYSPLDGSVGDASMIKVKFPCKGAITRATS